MSTQNSEHFTPTGPGAYDSSAPAPVPSGPQAAPKSRNLVAIVAFVAALVGFVFAVWEGAYIVGWILLPIAFILSLVALFQRDKPKRMALAALIIAIVGSIAGVLAFFSSVAGAFDEAFSDEPLTAEEAPPATDDTDDPAPAPEQQDEQGTRANPFPLGSTLSNDEWSVTVNSFDANATDAVLAENQFNDEPGPDQTYALANLTVTYLGNESGTPWEITVAYITESGNVINSHDALAVTPDELSHNELYTGASATGNISFMIPQDDAGVLRVQAGLFGEEVFVAIS